MNFWQLNPYTEMYLCYQFYQNFQPYQQFSHGNMQIKPQNSLLMVPTTQNRSVPTRKQQKQSEENSQFELQQQRPPRFYYQQNKNVTTNIINQIFSFLLYPKKSQKYLEKLLQQDQKKIAVFYAFMKTLKSTKSKYLNTANLIHLTFLPQGSKQLRLIQKRTSRFEILSLEELREVLRKLVFKVLRDDFFLNIFNSKKFNTNPHNVTNHMRKCRQLKQALEKFAQAQARINKNILTIKR